MAEDRESQIAEPLTYREIEILGLLAEGLTNREIADRLYLSYETIKWHNKQIYAKLGVTNRTQAASRARASGLLEGNGVSPASVSAPSGPHLPAQLTAFVGREPQIAELRELVGGESARLVTLTGPGGIGKTRLALAAASELRDPFTDGIYFVNLAPVRQPERVADAIASILHLESSAERPALELLSAYLSDRCMLLLIDNFEQVLEAAPLLVDLLSGAPELKIMVTSREALGVYGETEYAVPPLTLPDLDQLEIAPQPPPSESIELFSQRARAARPSFRISERNLQAVAEICVRLDGLPLAIELAAAMTKRLAPADLERQLARKVGALKAGPRGVPERQRTLQSTISWSYDLLEDDQKALFGGLSVFQGGFTLGAAEQVAGDRAAADVEKGLEALVNKNLLIQHGYSVEGRRFSMLQTIHELADQLLADTTDGERYRRRHAEYFASLAERAEAKLRGPEQDYWYGRIEADYENIRSALAWALGGGDRLVGLRLAAAMRDYWYYQGPSADGLHWMELALENLEWASAVLRAKVLLTAGHLLLHRGAAERGAALLEESLAIFRQHGDRWSEAWALLMLSYAVVGQGNRYEEGIGRCDHGLSIFRELKDEAGVAQALTIRGELARFQGEFALAEQSYREALELSRETGDRRRQCIQYANLGMVEHSRANSAAAEQHYVNGLQLSWAIGFTHLTAYLFASLAGPVEQRGDPAKAATLLGISAGMRYRSGTLEEAVDRPSIDRIIAKVKDRLSDEAFESAFHRGQMMGTEEALAYALEGSVV